MSSEEPSEKYSQPDIPDYEFVSVDEDGDPLWECIPPPPIQESRSESPKDTPVNFPDFELQMCNENWDDEIDENHTFQLPLTNLTMYDDVEEDDDDFLTFDDPSLVEELS